MSCRIQKALDNGFGERTLVMRDVQNVCEVPFGLSDCISVVSVGLDGWQTNFVQVICRPLTLEMKLESESDGMN